MHSGSRALAGAGSLLFALPLVLSVPASAQGRGAYVNVESPQVSPIALANVGGRRLLLVCNTPDNSLELWDTSETIQPPSQRFLQRERVGLEPVSVLVAGDRFWTANFLGDSVTTGRIEVIGPRPRLRVTATANVGDEPMDVALDAASNTIFVSLNTASAVAWLNADTLQPHVAGKPKDDLVQNPDPTPSDPPWGLKEPHMVRVHGGRVFALGFKGGVTHALSTHDLDLLSATLAAPLAFDRSVGGLGSTNFNGRFDSSGGLWVVGGEAKNFDNEDKIAVRNEPSGFVQSTLYRVIGPASAAPQVFRRDTNRTAAGAVVAVPLGEKALTMPTDLALFESGGAVRKAFVAAFSSDRIGVFAGTAASPIDIQTWTRRTIDYPTAPVGGNARWGPRGMVLGQNQGGAARLYVVNRLDNSVSVFDPGTETHVVSFPLANDPTPVHVRAGRQFLYSADLATNGFNSCASCHTDGRLDALSWKLGNPNAVGPFEPPPSLHFIYSLCGTGTVASEILFFIDMMLDFTPGVGFSANPMFDPQPPEDKREMVTQSLQGLSNFEVEFHPGASADQAEVVRRIFHNGPHHWRGDKPTLREFNEAFVTLLGAPNVGTVNDARGLTDPQMDQFEEFVHSITYPPNPQQPVNRRFSADDPSHPVYSSVYPGSGFAGGQTGMQLFHTQPQLLGNRSCVHCHSLPEGSNNRLTVLLPDVQHPGYVVTSNAQAIETAAMRGLLQKEPLLEPDGNFLNSPSTPVVGHFGLNHTGILESTTFLNPHTSINLFIDVFFADTLFTSRAIKQFAHEIDWGMAPAIGSVVHVPQPALSNPGLVAQLAAQIVALESQAREANAGFVVWGEYPGANPAVRGWRYYAPANTYLEEPSLTPWNLGQLASSLLQPADSLVFTSVPLGSERRTASTTGVSTNYPQLVPLNVTLLPMQPNTAYAVVPTLRDNWVPTTAPPAIIGGAAPFDFQKNANVDEVFAKTIRLFQYGLLDGQNANDYGLAQLRHEAPRRLRVQGDNIVSGAKLRLGMAYPTLPYAGPDPSTLAGQATLPLVTLELPLFATDQGTWETAAEVEPVWAYALMLGGLRAPGVQQTIDYVVGSELEAIAPGQFFVLGQFGLPNPAPVIEPTASNPGFVSPFDPDHWNWFKVEVRNPGLGGPDDATGPVSTAVWQQLTM